MATHDGSSPETRQVISKVEARQGVTGHNVRYVLGFGMVLIALAFAALWLVYFL